MNDVLMYFLKVNIAIALFYLFYRLVFYHDTFWATRRFYLVFSILLSAVYPLISVTGWLEKQQPMRAILTNYVQLHEITVSATPASTITMENLILAAYAIVSFILLGKMVFQLASVLRWKLKGKRLVLDGVEIMAIDAKITPFSFFRTIFMNPALHNKHETRQILTHESTHARQWHSLDILLSELLTVICWINPAAWLLKREIRHNLEFLADNSVVQSGNNPQSYQYHLLQLSCQIPKNQLINKFNVSPLKKRITMMNQQKTRKAGILKYSLIVPLALALVLSSNAEALVSKAKHIISQKTDESTESFTPISTTVPSSLKDSVIIEKKEVENPVESVVPESKTAPGATNNERTYTVVENMPQFPGGEKELMNYIARNLRYPVEAQQKGIQGKIILRFIVTKLGKVENAEVIRGIDASLDKEGLRVVKSLPDWIPGEQNGEKVDVYYTLPIAFKLDNSKGDKKVDKSAVDNFRKSLVVIVDGVVQPIGFDFKSINQEDIASVNVLKNGTEEERAELVAKYGENATHGVIMITKKK